MVNNQAVYTDEEIQKHILTKHYVPKNVLQVNELIYDVMGRILSVVSSVQRSVTTNRSVHRTMEVNES